MNEKVEDKRSLSGEDSKTENISIDIDKVNTEDLEKNIKMIERFIDNMKKTKTYEEFLNMARLLINSNADATYGQLKAILQWKKTVVKDAK